MWIIDVPVNSFRPDFKGESQAKCFIATTAQVALYQPHRGRYCMPTVNSLATYIVQEFDFTNFREAISPVPWEDWSRIAKFDEQVCARVASEIASQPIAAAPCRTANPGRYLGRTELRLDPCPIESEAQDRSQTHDLYQRDRDAHYNTYRRQFQCSLQVQVSNLFGPALRPGSWSGAWLD